MDKEINQICKRYRIWQMDMLRFLVAKGLEDVQKEFLEENLVKKLWSKCLNRSGNVEDR